MNHAHAHVAEFKIPDVPQSRIVNVENHAAARAGNSLPIALSQDCVLLRDLAKDALVTFDDVKLPPARLSDGLWAEQQRRWPGVARAGASSRVARPVAIA